MLREVLKNRKNRKLIKSNMLLDYKMPLGDIFKRFGSKKDVRDLKALAEEIQKIGKNVESALNRRREISQRIITSCEKLKTTPIDKKERRRLSWYLNVERRFLDMVRKGIKDTISILEATLKELRGVKKSQEKQIKRGKDPQLQKEYFEVITEMQTIQFLVDVMQFAKGKIKIIEKRIKKGEKLEESDYDGQHLNEFLQTIEDEKKIDMELALVLEGKSKQVRSKLNILRYMVKDPIILASGLGTAAVAAGEAYGVYSYDGTEFSSDSVLILAAVIIGVSVALMFSLARSTFDLEEGRRNLKGKVGDFIRIPR